MGKLSPLKIACIVYVICVAAAIAAPAQTFTSLLSFDVTNGANPQWGALVQGIDGNFYAFTAAAVFETPTVTVERFSKSPRASADHAARVHQWR